MPVIIPPYLKPGDCIAVTCPAGYMPYENAENCIRILQEQGYELLIGKTLGSSSETYFSGTDDKRLDELQAFLDAKEVKAILCGRGGYGTGRIIDRLDFKKFEKKPKWIIGFSDITVLHSHMYANYGIASMHAPMAAAFKEGNNEFTASLLSAIRGEKANYEIPGGTNNRNGKAKGKLVGGNLSLLAHLCGTSSDISTKNCILFIEDISEQLYNIDRMMYQLKRSGKLKNLAGLIVGGFTDLKDTERPFGKTVPGIIGELTAEYDYPVCFDFPVSHGKENYALKIGCTYTLEITGEQITLKEK